MIGRLNDMILGNIYLRCWVALVIPLLAAGFPAASSGDSLKPRVIVTTDGETDDRCSMNRFLLYANEWNIKGLIHSSSKHHWKGDANHPAKKWQPVGWLDRQLDAYELVYPNLIRHESGYPTPEYLHAQVFVGNIAREGDMREATPGSNRIVDVLFEEDDSPVWLQAWGGPNTIARALKTIQEEHPQRMEEVSRKARIYMISAQDATYKTYILPEWPNLQVLRSGAPSYGVIAYHWRKVQPVDAQAYFERPWMQSNIVDNHGPLCAMYETKDGHFRSEGDSPAFLHTIDTGLRSLEHPSYGGWGGRFAFSGGAWRSVDTEGSTPHSITRWAKDFQNDWAARADWCVKSYEDANHPPEIKFAQPLDRIAHPGDVIALNGGGTTDPDGDTLKLRWWVYGSASRVSGNLLIENDEEAVATLTIPRDAKQGDTIHVVCTATDDGTPILSKHARVIITIGNEHTE